MVILFLHIGGSQIVFFKDLIGIFNLDLAESEDIDRYLNTNSSDLIRISSASERSKSIVVTEKKIFISPISPLTLSKRRNPSS